jgi:hypothetical protein
MVSPRSVRDLRRLGLSTRLWVRRPLAESHQDTLTATVAAAWPRSFSANQPFAPDIAKPREAASIAGMPGSAVRPDTAPKGPPLPDRIHSRELVLTICRYISAVPHFVYLPPKKCGFTPPLKASNTRRCIWGPMTAFAKPAAPSARAGERRAGELAALIGIEDFRLAVTSQSIGSSPGSTALPVCGHGGFVSPRPRFTFATA